MSKKKNELFTFFWNENKFICLNQLQKEIYIEKSISDVFNFSLATGCLCVCVGRIKSIHDQVQKSDIVLTVETSSGVGEDNVDQILLDSFATLAVAFIITAVATTVTVLAVETKCVVFGHLGAVCFPKK